jgi:hypothetical protein
MRHAELVPLPVADCSLVVGRMTQRLAGASEERHWTACACLWARTFTEARTAWERWPAQHDAGLAALRHALDAAAGRAVPSGAVDAIRRRPVPEDDGSPEWGLALVFFEMTEPALSGTSAQRCLAEGAQAYLEEIFRIISCDLAEAAGRPISETRARQGVPADQRWQDAAAFINAI